MTLCVLALGNLCRRIAEWSDRYAVEHGSFVPPSIVEELGNLARRRA